MEAPVKLAEELLNMTMNYGGKWGNKGFEQSSNNFIHDVFVTDINTSMELHSESTPSGNLPISTAYGLKIPTISVTGYFPYRYPDEFWDVFMPTLSEYRHVNSVKNVFLAGSLLIVSSSNVIMSELPVESKWFIKKYTWKRDASHPDRGQFNLILYRWFKG